MPSKKIVLTFTVEVESDQESPPIGTIFDAVNDTWTFFDVKLTNKELKDA